MSWQIWLACVVLWQAPPTSNQADAKYSDERVRGQVVYLHESLPGDLPVRPSPDAKESVLALKTDDGRLLPLFEDTRGHAFRLDQRLRKMHVELHLRRYPQSPMRQVLGVFEVTGEGDQAIVSSEIVYWCEICAILLFELRPCSCCQGPIELQRRPLRDSK